MNCSCVHTHTHVWINNQMSVYCVLCTFVQVRDNKYRPLGHIVLNREDNNDFINLYGVIIETVYFQHKNVSNIYKHKIV